MPLGVKYAETGQYRGERGKYDVTGPTSTRHSAAETLPQLTQTLINRALNNNLLGSNLIFLLYSFFLRTGWTVVPSFWTE